MQEPGSPQRRLHIESSMDHNNYSVKVSNSPLLKWNGELALEPIAFPELPSHLTTPPKNTKSTTCEEIKSEAPEPDLILKLLKRKSSSLIMNLEDPQSNHASGIDSNNKSQNQERVMKLDKPTKVEVVPIRIPEQTTRTSSDLQIKHSVRALNDSHDINVSNFDKYLQLEKVDPDRRSIIRNKKSSASRYSFSRPSPLQVLYENEPRVGFNFDDLKN